MRDAGRRARARAHATLRPSPVVVDDDDVDVDAIDGARGVDVATTGAVDVFE